jgi:hypothetical protein
MSTAPRLACLCLLAAALTGVSAGGIYTCVDAKGRKLTSDRPLAECADREQKELNANGTVRRVIPPAQTAVERAAQEEKDRKAQEERQRLAEQKRVQKVLVARYPNRAAHDVDRAKALQAVDEVIASAQKRVGDLRDERTKLDQEAERHKEPAKWPPKLKRQLEDNDQQLAAQQRFIAAQEQERKRVNDRFDLELAQLKQLWTQNGTTTTASETAPVTR